MKGNACLRVGIEPLKIELPESTTTETLIARIQELNEDGRVHGILLQHPVPHQIDEQKCFNTISIQKDVDGVNTGTFGRMVVILV
jgi:methylenetetrahydrofolate dehydrogenase (NADP+)/methenyltetrahydrofolate cyclohydrolase